MGGFSFRQDFGMAVSRASVPFSFASFRQDFGMAVSRSRRIFQLGVAVPRSRRISQLGVAVPRSRRIFQLGVAVPRSLVFFDPDGSCVHFRAPSFFSILAVPARISAHPRFFRSSRFLRAFQHTLVFFESDGSCAHSRAPSFFWGSEKFPGFRCAFAVLRLHFFEGALRLAAERLRWGCWSFL